VVATARPVMVVLAPIAPAATGNGLAMRVHALIGAAGVDHEVHVVVVPVSGSTAAPLRLSDGVVSHHEFPVTGPVDRAPMVALLADPSWRRRLSALSPLPDTVVLAPPTLAAAVVSLLPQGPVAAVLACRLTMAVLGLAVAEATGALLLIDSDDGDADYFTQCGEHAVAAGWDRVAQLCLPLAAMVSTANSTDGASLARRYDLTGQTVTVPNSVDIPPASECPDPTAGSRILFLGNMTYPPNGEGAHWLVASVLPLLGSQFEVSIVGNAPPGIMELAGPSVDVTGWVADVGPHYRSANVSVVPVMSGSGTRTKILESFAWRRPVVTTSVGLTGIDAQDQLHVRVADSPQAFATAIEALATSDVATTQVDAARALVVDRYSREVICASTARLFSQLTSGSSR
jgi:glycosyltransferase involved in cell wall biosynthesis